MPEQKIIQWNMPVDVAVYFMSLISLANVVLEDVSNYGSLSEGFPNCCLSHKFIFEQAFRHATHEEQVEAANKCLYDMVKMLEENSVSAAAATDIETVIDISDEMKKRRRFDA